MISLFEEHPTKMVRIVILLVFIAEVWSKPQDNSPDEVCNGCGDVVNEYCCRYTDKCCEYINPDGCPTPSSPETRVACRNPIRCRSNVDCPSFRQCCNTVMCGPACMAVNSTFEGYKY